eukprot:gene7265-7478_t
MPGLVIRRIFASPDRPAHISFSMWSDESRNRFGGALDYSRSPYYSHFTDLRRIVCDDHVQPPGNLPAQAFDGEVRAAIPFNHGSVPDNPEQAAWEASAHTNLTAFKSSILEAVQKSGNRPFKREMWDMFAPVATCPPGRPLKRYPDAFEEEHHGDGQKLLCSLEEKEAQTLDCIIYSMGSNGDYQFEDSMLTSTKCQIHTFDCTYNGTSRDPQRHFYHKWCVGTVPGKPEYMSLRRIMEVLGHRDVHLMKIDVEGYEYPVLAEMRPTDHLPTEIAIEFHIGWRLKSASSSGELALVWLHLASLGYATYAHEINEVIPNEGCEFSFIRITPKVSPSSAGTVASKQEVAFGRRNRLYYD